jgi:FKBP-type peptidyl-prolyl cis-trans isomerase SlpA
MSDIIASSESSKPKIKMGSSVKLHFALLMPSGEEIDTTRRGSPASLVLGDGNLLPGFDAVLVGLQEGDDVQLTVLAEDAFGARNEANIRVLDSQDGLEQGLVVSFQAPDGELPGVVVDVYEDTVKVDFNHPLSGKDIIFDVSILSVDEPMANEAGQIN